MKQSARKVRASDSYSEFVSCAAANRSEEIRFFAPEGHGVFCRRSQSCCGLFVSGRIGAGPIYFFAGIISASMVMEISSPIIPGPYVMPKSWRMILELALTPMR
jgi:hypothetical protein